MSSRRKPGPKPGPKRAAKSKARDRISLLEVDGGTLPLRTRRDSRARRMTLRIDASNDCVVLVLPSRVPLIEGLNFARSKADWLKDKLAELPPRALFADGTVLRVHGRTITIRHEPALGARIIESDGVLRIGGEAALLRGRVNRWLREAARKVIAERVAHHAERLGKRYRRISLRDPRTRWGSCTTSGNLSFSWRLILAPPEVLDYVVCHEVAHLAEMNHGPRFWKLVERLAPHTEAARRWLSNHGTALLRQG